jgi:hypothetical protein
MSAMTPQRRHQLRTALLIIIESVKPFAAELPLIRIGLPTHGFRAMEDEVVLTELDYLVEKRFVAKDGAKLAPELGKWKITADGRDFLATEGLA